jgi:hypothetical protein
VYSSVFWYLLVLLYRCRPWMQVFIMSLVCLLWRPLSSSRCADFENWGFVLPVLSGCWCKTVCQAAATGQMRQLWCFYFQNKNVCARLGGEMLLIMWNDKFSSVGPKVPCRI